MTHTSALPTMPRGVLLSILQCEMTTQGQTNLPRKPARGAEIELDEVSPLFRYALQLRCLLEFCGFDLQLCDQFCERCFRKFWAVRPNATADVDRAEHGGVA